MNRRSLTPFACRALFLFLILTMFGNWAVAFFHQDSGNPVVLSDNVYAEHLARMMKLLPPESGPPPLLDLLKAGIPGASKKWEDRFTGSMGVRPITDPGVTSLADATSMSLTTNESMGQFPSLPVTKSVIVASGVPIEANAHLAYNRRFVYSLYQVSLLEVFKGMHRPRSKARDGKIICGVLGGSVRFPSRHQTTFLEAKRGFLEIGSHYIFFLWKPVPKDDVYMISDAYLLKDEVVFPVHLESNNRRYSGMPSEEFLKKLRSAVAENKDVM